MDTQVCTYCKEEKSVSDFYKKSGKEGILTRCKACLRLLHKIYRDKNRDRKNARDREYKRKNKKIIDEKNREYARKNRLEINKRALHHRRKYLYGVTKEGYEKLLVLFPVCPICSSPFSPWPHIDHDHKTGKVRGLLCQPCNLMLGHLRDSPEIIRSAIEYLKKHQDEQQ